MFYVNDELRCSYERAEVEKVNRNFFWVISYSIYVG